MRIPTWSSPKSSSNNASFGSHAITQPLAMKAPLTSITSHYFLLQPQRPNEGTFGWLSWPFLPRVHRLAIKVLMWPLELSSLLRETLSSVLLSSFDLVKIGSSSMEDVGACIDKKWNFLHSQIIESLHVTWIHSSPFHKIYWCWCYSNLQRHVLYRPKTINA